MAKKKQTVVDDSLFTFENPKDILKGYFIEVDDDGNYVFEDEDEKEFRLKPFPQLLTALDTPVNGKKVREGDYLIEIEYLGETTRNGEPYQAYRVSVE